MFLHFLIKYFLTQTRTGFEDPIPSPLLHHERNKTTVDESSILLNTQIGRRSEEIRQIEKDVRHLEDRIKQNERNGSLTIVKQLKDRLLEKKTNHKKLKHLENDLLAKRDQIRTKRTDLF